MSVSPRWCLGELPLLNGLGSHGQTASTDSKEHDERPDQQTQHRPQHAVQKHTGIMGTLPKHIIWPAGEDREGCSLVNGPQQANTAKKPNKVLCLSENIGIGYCHLILSLSIVARSWSHPQTLSLQAGAGCILGRSPTYCRSSCAFL